MTDKIEKLFKIEKLYKNGDFLGGFKSDGSTRSSIITGHAFFTT